jgi:murein L,D-transpeptidase YcbB/YkuD
VGRQITRLIAAALLCGSSPALAQSGPGSLTPALVTVAPLPATPAVNAYYQLNGNAPIWLKNATTTEAARMLPAILERAALDGLANGPELARMVEDAIARAEAAAPASHTDARPAALVAADKLLSAAWVQYVRALKAPVRGMTWGDPLLAPRLPSPHQVLAEALKAASLAEHVRAIASVNPIYAQLRDAAWRDLRLSGQSVPDARLAANLERSRMLPASGRFIAVNAATQQLWMVEDGGVTDTMKVVVGKPDTPTPMLSGTIYYATFNPYWNIPTDVARRAVAPLVLKRGTAYLRAARYEVISGWNDASVVAPDTVDWKAVAAGTVEVHIRQLPGPANMMGALKFGFVNDLGIYLHDTPHKQLFAKEQRTFSLGCVRVEDAKRLGRWLLGAEPVPPSDQPEQSVRLPKAVPVYITYLTASADGGRLAFTNDVYRLDPKPETALAEIEPLTVATTASAAVTDVTAAPH